MIKFGIVGVGTHARQAVVHAIEKTSKNCKLVAACDIRDDNLKDLATRGIKTFTDLNEMLQAVELDALYVATTASTHYEIAMNALGKGLHVICEKPMADSIEKCENMIKAAEKANRKLAITFENRYHPEIRKIKEWIDAGYLGKLEAFHYQFFTSQYKTFGPYADRRNRLLDLAGVLDCGIHTLDLARYFFKGEWADVCARGAWFGEGLANAPHISVLGRMTSGVMANVNYSYAYGAYYEAEAKNHTFTIIGTEGIIDYHSDSRTPSEMKLISKNHKENFLVEGTAHKLAIGWLADDFAAVIEGNKEWPRELAGGHDGLAAQKIMEEALIQTRNTKFSQDAAC